MTPAEIRRRALEEHRLIEGHVARLEALADRVAGVDGLASVEALEGGLRTLRNVLCTHLAWEEATLLGAADDDPWWSTCGEWLRASHDELRTVLDFCDHACGRENHPLVLARRVRDLAQLVGSALRLEEEVAIGQDGR